MTAEPYVVHFYNAAKQFYVRDRYGAFLGSTDGDLAGGESWSVIAQRWADGPWIVLSAHDSYGAAVTQAGHVRASSSFRQVVAKRLEGYVDSFPVPGAAGRFIRYAFHAQDLADDGVTVLGLDDRDRMVWLTECIALWFGDLRVEDGGPFAETLVDGETDSTTIDNAWAAYQADGTENTDPGPEPTEAMYGALSAFSGTELQTLWIATWHNRGTGGTWPGGAPVGGGA